MNARLKRRVLVVWLGAACAFAGGRVLASPPDSTLQSTLAKPSRARYVSTNLAALISGIRYITDNTFFDLQFYREPILTQGQTGWRRRLGLGLRGAYGHDWKQPDDPDGGTRESSLSADVTFLWARERIWQTSPRFKVGLGPFISAGYSLDTHREFEQDGSGRNTWVMTKSSATHAPNVNAGALLSLNWQATPWLILAGESQLGLANGYRFGTYKTDDGYNDPILNRSASFSSRISFFPLYRLSASFRFQ